MVSRPYAGFFPIMSHVIGSIKRIVCAAAECFTMPNYGRQSAACSDAARYGTKPLSQSVSHWVKPSTSQDREMRWSTILLRAGLPGEIVMTRNGKTRNHLTRQQCRIQGAGQIMTPSSMAIGFGSRPTDTLTRHKLVK